MARHLQHPLKYTALAVLLVLSQPEARADLSVGSVFGQAPTGSSISIRNLDTGLKRELKVDAQGRFVFSQLPTGRYQLSGNGQTLDLTVVIGTGTPINLNVDNTERIVVSGSRINRIDTSSVEASTVFTAEQLQSLPIGRDISDVAMLAPGTVRGDSGFGKLASFGGASVAENGYYINGFDVTNARTFLSYGRVPFDAIGQQEVKTGGFGAEYGRALGGVINIATKRGSNDWQFNSSAVWTPSSLTASGKDVVSRSGTAGNRDYLSAYRSADKSEQLSVSVGGGGALIEDKLFVYALVEGKRDRSDIYQVDRSEKTDNSTPNYLAKFDWYVTDNHILEFTGIRNKEKTDYELFLNNDDQYYTGNHGNPRTRYTRHDGGNILIGKYTGHLTDDLTVSVLYGKLDQDSAYMTPDPLPGDECPLVDIYDQDTDDVIDVGCWNNINVRSLDFGPDNDQRKALRLSAEWRLGSHTLKMGFDDETFTSRIAGAEYTGGVFYRLYTPVDFADRWNGVDVPAGANVVRKRTRTSPSGKYEVKNRAFYIEDSFYLNDNLMLYVGLRNESFDNLNADGVSFVKADDMLAPRFGFVWDVNGDARSKLYANAGRYYIPIAANTNVRASNWQYVTTEYYLYDGQVDPVTRAPLQLGQQLGNTQTSGRNSSPDPATVASADLEPMLQDELIFGYQRELSERWTAGASLIYREVKNGVDDYCGRQAFVDFAADQGFANFDADTLSTCIILNPGRDLVMDMDVANDGNLQRVTVPNSYLQLEKYKRTYKALELSFERSRDDGWYLQGSYVLAKSSGNSEGLVNSWLESESPGLTNDFDHKVYVDGTNGNLSNDRRHTFKIFGGYELTENLEVNANLVVQSGRPVSCFGYAPFPVDDPEYEVFERYAASSLYCRNAAGEQELTQRGQFGRTPWTYTVDLGVSYYPQWADGLVLQLNVFNLLNTQRVTEYSEKGDLTLESSGQNPNFLNDLNYQSPRSVRLTARYNF